MHPVRFALIRPLSISLVLIGMASCWSDSACENVPLSEAVSPDGHRKIVIFSRECGATTGSNYQGTIIDVGAPYPKDTGTVFIANEDDVTVRWDLPTVITVKMAKGRSVIQQNTLVDGVRIDYP